MKCKKLEELMHWIYEELETIDHGEIHVVFKVRDHKVTLVERVKIEKKSPRISTIVSIVSHPARCLRLRLPQQC